MPEVRLLIVDDEPEIGRLVCKVARKMGYVAQATQSSRDFQTRYAVWQPDVVVIDLAIPEVDGVELLSFLGSANSTARILLISGMDANMLRLAENLGQAYGLRMAGSIEKPFRAADLEAALTTAMESDAAEASPEIV